MAVDGSKRRASNRLKQQTPPKWNLEARTHSRTTLCASRAVAWNPLMPSVTQILSQLEPGDPTATEKLLPIVYDELRSMALARMAGEKPGQTLQATALVHEAFLRLVDSPAGTNWNSRAHFFSAASEAMRRILVERARAKKRNKRGGGQWKRIDLAQAIAPEKSSPDLILAVSDALEVLAAEDPQLAELVKLRSFSGFSLPQAAEILGLPTSTAYVRWEYAKSRLRCLLEPQAS